MIKKILQGDRAGDWLGWAKGKLAARKTSMELGGLSQTNHVTYPEANVSVKLKSDFGLDVIEIEDEEAGSVTTNLIFATEWGLQGFRLFASIHNAKLTPIDIVKNPDDVFSIATSGHVELDEFLNIVRVKGSAVSSISRVNKLYTFSTNRSQQDIPAGMAYDLYADKIHSYGADGYASVSDPGSIYYNIAEDYSAGTDLGRSNLYTPFSTGLEVDPIHGEPYNFISGLKDVDAYGRRPYNVNFQDGILITNDEHVSNSRLIKVSESVYLDWHDININAWSDQEDVLFFMPPGTTYTNPSFSDIDHVTDQRCVPGIGIQDVTAPGLFRISYSSGVSGEHETLHYYQEREEVNPGEYKLIRKNIPFFVNTFNLSLNVTWGPFSYTQNVCEDYGIFTRTTWSMKSYHADTTRETVDVRACLGNGKFIYDRTSSHNIMHTTYSSVIDAIDLGNLYGNGRLDEVSNSSSSSTAIYIGNHLIRTNTYLATTTNRFLNVSDGDLNPIMRTPAEPITSRQTDIINKTETYWMDYDYDLEHGENGVFFFQNIETISTNTDTMDTWPVGYAAGDRTIVYDETINYSYGIVIILNGSLSITTLPYGYSTNRKRYMHSTYLATDDTDYYYLQTVGKRIWLTSSYISNKEMVFSYLIEDVEIAAGTTYTLTTTPFKRVTEYINIANPALPAGYRKAFETLPISRTSKPNFTITKKHGSGGPARSLKVMVVAMTTINMSEPKEPVEVELDTDEYFNVSYSAVAGATHYGIFISPTGPPLLWGGGDPDEWFKPIITAELSIDITEALLAASGSDTRNMSMHGSSYDILKHGDVDFSTTNLKSPKLVPAIGIYKQATI